MEDLSLPVSERCELVSGLRRPLEGLMWRSFKAGGSLETAPLIHYQCRRAGFTEGAGRSI